jgi:hypothetical protein
MCAGRFCWFLCSCRWCGPVCGQSPMFALMAAAGLLRPCSSSCTLDCQRTQPRGSCNICAAMPSSTSLESSRSSEPGFYVDNFHFQALHCCKAYDTGTAPHRYLCQYRAFAWYVCIRDRKVALTFSEGHSGLAPFFTCNNIAMRTRWNQHTFCTR